MRILHIKAIEILDSRGNPTLKVEVVLEDGSQGEFSVPSGASTGVHEAWELRDEDKSRYLGKGVRLAIENIESLRKELYAHSFTQKSLDDFLRAKDGTVNKSKLGANAILGVSIAFSKACARYYNLPLYEYLYRMYAKKSMSSKALQCSHTPLLFSNIINGGEHADNELMVQECMVICTSLDIVQSVQKTAEVYHILKKNIKKKFGAGSTGLGDEGGFAPNVKSVDESFELITESLKELGYEDDFVYAIDAAASEFYDQKLNSYEIEKGKKVTGVELCKYYTRLIKKYPLVSIEDAYAEDDFKGFADFMKSISSMKVENLRALKKSMSSNSEMFSTVLSVGDDLLVTNPKRLELAISKKLCNALLLKINQIGTLTEAMEASKIAQKANFRVIVSHRSGETPDTFISDLAVALGGDIKLGAPARGERVAKYNRLLEICSTHCDK